MPEIILLQSGNKDGKILAAFQYRTASQYRVQNPKLSTNLGCSFRQIR